MHGQGRAERMVQRVLRVDSPIEGGDVIPWDGIDLHDPEREGGCWGDRNGVECGDPVVNLGLCGDCLVRLGGERPVMPLPAPDSEAFRTGAGRR